MNSFIVAVAQYLLFVILAAAGVIWLYLPRRDKVGLAFQAIVSLVIAVGLIGVAAAAAVATVVLFIVEPRLHAKKMDHAALRLTPAGLVF